jgi:GxxExxY protein
MPDTGAPPDLSKPLAQEGYDIMAAVFEVHHHLGGGLLEEIYQESLEIELGIRGIPFVACQELRLFYKDRLLKKRYIPDLHLHGKIVVELKALRQLLPEHEGQLINYMRITRMPVGYLVNFGPMSKVEWKRLVLSEYL